MCFQHALFLATWLVTFFLTAWYLICPISYIPSLRYLICTSFVFSNLLTLAPCLIVDFSTMSDTYTPPVVIESSSSSPLLHICKHLHSFETTDTHPCASHVCNQRTNEVYIDFLKQYSRAGGSNLGIILNTGATDTKIAPIIFPLFILQWDSSPGRWSNLHSRKFNTIKWLAKLE